MGSCAYSAVICWPGGFLEAVTRNAVRVRIDVDRWLKIVLITDSWYHADAMFNYLCHKTLELSERFRLVGSKSREFSRYLGGSSV